MLATMMSNAVKLAVAVVALATSAAWAVGPEGADPGASAPPGAVGADVGTGWNILQIPAAAFTPRGGSNGDYSGFGYITWAGPQFSAFWAPVFLPSGVGIGYLNLYAYDTNTSNDIEADLSIFTGFGTAPCAILCPPPIPPGADVVTSVASSGSGGYQYRSSAPLNPLHTVDNNVRGGGAQYVVEVEMSHITTLTDGSLRFKGVDIWWKRQISPAPGSASFTDVPMSAQFFAEIEALKASGITLGCTVTEFCPDTTLTRRQMAAFLARALGLYWQY